MPLEQGREHVETFFRVQARKHLSEFYLSHLGSTLRKHGLLVFSVPKDATSSVSAHTLLTVLDRIAQATLEEDTPFRCMTSKFLACGDETLGYYWLPLTTRTVKSALSVLEQYGLIFRLKSRNAKAIYYALDLRRILYLTRTALERHSGVAITQEIDCLIGVPGMHTLYAELARYHDCYVTTNATGSAVYAELQAVGSVPELHAI